MAVMFKVSSESILVHRFDRESAHRQFRLSLFLIAAIAFAALTLNSALPINSPHSLQLNPIANNQVSVSS
jgi:hypothetical protein